MKETEIEPKVKKRFYLKNFLKIIRLQLSNRSKIEKFIEGVERLNKPITDLFEGKGGPMEEGMIYLLFDSENGSSNPENFDSVYRIFWILGPDLNYHQIDAFLISTNPDLSTGQWRRFDRNNFFKNLSKNRFHQEVKEEPINFEFDGVWEEGYEFEFDDKIHGLAGDLNYNPIAPEGTLVYYNGEAATAPQLLLKFYDSFGIEVTGSIEFGEHNINLSGGRGIIEHGLGIFSIENIYEWRWMDLQGEDTSIHLFFHPITLDDGEEELIPAGEGAALINGNWHHYLRDDFEIEELEFEDDENIPTKVPVKWRVKAGFKSSDASEQLDLEVVKLTHHSWFAEASGTTRHFTTNYLLEFEGTYGDESIKGRGTMEYLFERVIE